MSFQRLALEHQLLIFSTFPVSCAEIKGKIKIELIAFASGTDAYLKGSAYQDELKDLAERGVIISQCHNTLVAKKLTKNDIYDFIAVVPSGVGELIIRQAQGWAVVKP